MPKRQAMLSYTTETICEPIIYTISQQFNVVTNIRQADLTKDRGWIIVEFIGDDADIEAGIAWATSRGIRVDLVSET
jgi:hypothetical protein